MDINFTKYALYLRLLGGNHAEIRPLNTTIVMQTLDVNQYPEQQARCKNSLQSLFVNQQHDWNTLKRYLLVPFAPYPDFSASVQPLSFEWSDEDQLVMNPDATIRNHIYTNRFTANARVIFTHPQQSEAPTEVEHTFDITAKYYFDFHESSTPIYEFLDSHRLLLSDLNDSIFRFYQANGLEADQLRLEGELLEDRFMKTIHNSQPPVQADPFNVWFEIIYCLQRVRYSIGNMALYHPYLDNPIWHGHFFQTGFVYPSYASLYDERYFLYCEFTYQSLYNFWDRVGDTLALAIQTGIAPTAVDFARVIDAINKSALNGNNHFQWLFGFKSGDYKIMNDDRKRTVHYETITSKMISRHMESFTDRQKTEERQKWIESRLSYFIRQYHLCVEGLQQLTLLLETK